MPDTAKNSVPVCPVGEAQCPIIDKLIQARAENLELSELVRTDTLTGLFNFRHFSSSLENEMERSRRTLLPTGLIIVDLDHFKKVNDTWGHDTGNEALIQTAELMRRFLRKIDIACRYGGEEFAIILPSTDLHTSLQVAERLRAAIEEKPLISGDNTIKLNASMGVDIFKGHEGDSPQQFIKRTDSLLYQAKNEGRNRVCGANYETPEAATQVSHEEKDALFGLFNDDQEN
jgi:diguanylate cyclase (GGDEF)-like protein